LFPPAIYGWPCMQCISVHGSNVWIRTYSYATIHIKWTHVRVTDGPYPGCPSAQGPSAYGRARASTRIKESCNARVDFVRLSERALTSMNVSWHNLILDIFILTINNINRREYIFSRKDPLC
jgi:hypothetical protein